MITELEKEMESGISQFWADKVALQYQVPRKIVVVAFEAMVEAGKGGSKGCYTGNEVKKEMEPKEQAIEYKDSA